MTGKDVLMDFLLAAEAAADRQGWDARPQLLVLRRRSDTFTAVNSPLLQRHHVLPEFLENLTVATAVNAAARHRFLASVGPNVHGLCLLNEGWGVFDSESIAQVAKSTERRPISRHPSRREVRTLTAVVAGRDLYIQRIRGGAAVVLFDSSSSPFGCALQGRIPEALRGLVGTIHNSA
ncbi:hypothetical protein [Catellatospora methionotrophica]|uniref:hypothetical protein n=1 Tax=Catellatospora methionotrophica TaxID=121620 RepID=UPI003401293D